MSSTLQRLSAGYASLLPTDGPRLIASILVIGGGSASAGAAVMPPLACLGVCLIGAALLFPCLRRQAYAEWLATELCAPGARRRLPLSETLPRIGGALAGIEHRLDQIHPVTGLPTRERLLNVMAHDATDCPRLIGLIRLADYDRLAAFDQRGAAHVLARFAERLASAIDDKHFLAQVDRDCFAIWFRSEQTAALAEFRAVLYVAAQEIAVEGSILTPLTEAATAITEDDEEPLRLLTRALAGLARPVLAPSGETLLPQSPTAGEIRTRFRLEQDLARALAEDQMTMMFQPVVDLANGRLIGAEALLRWEHPELGSVSPAQFIPVVEETGLSDRYGLWVLNAACREARLWRDEGLVGLRVAVNLSACQLDDVALPLKIGRTLARHGLDPAALELELTETAAMADAGSTQRLLAELAAMGMSLAIDDFGSGYSSLSYLKNLPFNKLKIDREFVTAVHRRRDSRAICKALIALGQGLDLVVLAEGVESAEEVAMLRKMGCDVFQGYFFSRPLAGPDFRALARDPRWCASLRASAGCGSDLAERLSA